jgi:hypothetical protein
MIYILCPSSYYSQKKKTLEKEDGSKRKTWINVPYDAWWLDLGAKNSHN